jgi:hypothetical protein
MIISAKCRFYTDASTNYSALVRIRSGAPVPYRSKNRGVEVARGDACGNGGTGAGDDGLLAVQDDAGNKPAQVTALQGLRSVQQAALQGGGECLCLLMG